MPAPGPAPRLMEVFNEALELTSAEERAAYLDRVCGTDRSLRARVEGLLGAHVEGDGFLEAPAAAPTVDTPPGDRPSPEEGAGDQIGPYKLMEQIGEGGMGAVYVAEQHQPVRRKVALKIIKPGMDTRQVVARFEAERQALAMMDHPNIAKVHDGGATDSGRPFFVMELVRGLPITEYCDREQLAIPERLELFVLVCRAVQHAHQKGIIHRDLKPSNILVTIIDGVAVPKVIDFGVAKATGAALTDRTIYTSFQQFIGTPLYMSPEQADLSGTDIDTRSDLYSLGVLLYELLTGTTPFDQDTFRKAAFDELRRIIREDEPPRPSTRLSSLGETRTTVSANRKTDVRQLDRTVRGDLDWIVMKALEKDRKRRYETANDFAADVMRYLTDQPVEASPPSAGYRLRKFVRRNRGPVAAGLSLAALLVLGTVGTSIGLVRALRAERAATRETERASAAEAKAKEEAAAAEAIIAFLQDDLLTQASPDENPRDKQVTVEELLSRAAARIEGKFTDQPAVEAVIQGTIGNTYVSLGNYSAARPHLERAWELYRDNLGAENLLSLVALNKLAVLYMNQGQLHDAEQLLDKVLAVRCRVLGEDNPDTLGSKVDLGEVYWHQGRLDEAELLFLKAMEIARARGAEDLKAMNNLAVLYLTQRQYSKAEELLNEKLKANLRVDGEEAVSTLNTMTNLGAAYTGQGDYHKAAEMLARALEISRRVRGEGHRSTFVLMNNLARAYQSAKRFDLSVPLFEELVSKCLDEFGPEDADTIFSMTNLGANYRDSGRVDEGIATLERAWELHRKQAGAPSERDPWVPHMLGEAYQLAGQFGKAEPLYREALELARAREARGASPEQTLELMGHLAKGYWTDKKLDRSVPLFEEILSRTRDHRGQDHPETLRATANLGVNYRDAGRLQEGLTLLKEAWERARNRPGPLDRRLAWIRPELIEAYERAGRFTDSEPLYREIIADARRRSGEPRQESTNLLAALCMRLLRKQKYAEVDPFLRECLDLRAETWPDDWKTFSSRFMLGQSLLGQGKYDEAEPLLLAGYEGMKQREETIPPQGKVLRTQGIERVVRLYEATGQKDKAAEWRAKLPVAKSAKPAEAATRPGLNELPDDLFAPP